MVSFKLTVLLTAATFFLGASAHAFPDSNLLPGPNGLSHRALGGNASPIPGTPGRLGRLKKKTHQFTGGKLHRNKGSNVVDDPSSDGANLSDAKGGDTELPPARTSGGRFGRIKEKAHRLTGGKSHSNKDSKVANDPASEDNANLEGVNDTGSPPSSTSGSRLRSVKEKAHGLTNDFFRKNSKGKQINEETDEWVPVVEEYSSQEGSANDEDVNNGQSGGM
ncbi:hypothetical protein RSOL_311870, partial [Rhizoctonia solani AG-3 Rhs1AP]